VGSASRLPIHQYVPVLLGAIRERRPLLEVAGLTLLWCAASVGLALWFSGRIRDWSVMTDELLYAKLATAIAETGSPLPEVHGTAVSTINQLYPLLVAPLFGALSPPDAFRAAHVLNAVVMTSAVFPVYLLGRGVLPRSWSFVVAGLSVVVPWMVLTGFLMTEAVAYPVFLWTLVAIRSSIVTPRLRNDAIVVLALAAAVLARTQFAALILVLPAAILGYEIGQALTSTGSARTWRTPLSGAGEAVRRHAPLTALYAAGVAIAAAAAVVGSVGGLLGTYSVTVDGPVLPAEVWPAAARHLDAVGIGCGLVPLILGGGWMLAAAARPRDRQQHASATLFLLTVAVFAVETASFDVRFGGSDVIRDRYLFYIVPLLLVGAAAALNTSARRGVAVGAGVVTIFFVATVPSASFPTYAGLSVDSPPASVLNELLIEQSAALSTGTFVAVLGLLVGAVLVLGMLFVPRRVLAAVVFVGVLGFSVLTLRSEVDRVLGGTGLSGRPLAKDPGVVLDWVDSALPEGATAALVPFPVSTAWDTSAIRWWDVEFWNRSIVDTYVATDGNFSYTSFPRHPLDIDWATGRVAGTTDAPPFVITAPGDPRFGLAGRQHAANFGLVVNAVDRPYRAVWASRGLDTDGWTRPGRPATIRIYNGGDRPMVIDVAVSLYAPPDAEARYTLAGAGVTRRERLSAGQAKAEAVSACIAARSADDITITASGGDRIDGPALGPEIRTTRTVGVGVGQIAVRPTERSCRPGG
jgi:hypothetical protein